MQQTLSIGIVVNGSDNMAHKAQWQDKIDLDKSKTVERHLSCWSKGKSYRKFCDRPYFMVEFGAVKNYHIHSTSIANMKIQRCTSEISRS